MTHQNSPPKKWTARLDRKTCACVVNCVWYTKNNSLCACVWACKKFLKNSEELKQHLSCKDYDKEIILLWIILELSKIYVIISSVQNSNENPKKANVQIK